MKPIGAKITNYTCLDAHRPVAQPAKRAASYSPRRASRGITAGPQPIRREPRRGGVRALLVDSRPSLWPDVAPPGLTASPARSSHGFEGVKESSEVRKHVLAKAPSRKGRKENRRLVLHGLCDLAPLREIVLIFSQLLRRGLHDRARFAGCEATSELILALLRFHLRLLTVSRLAGALAVGCFPSSCNQRNLCNLRIIPHGLSRTAFASGRSDDAV